MGSYFTIFVVVFLTVGSALTAGLQVALFSIDSIILRVWMTAGDEKQKQRAHKLIKFFHRYHWTLVSLIICNSFCMMTLPLVLDTLVEPVTALILSITVVLFVGEVIPLAFFVRHSIPICAFFSPLISFCILITAPLSYFVGRLLDHILGSHEELLDRGELAALLIPIELDAEMDSRGAKELSDEEVVNPHLRETDVIGLGGPPPLARQVASPAPSDAFRLREEEIRMLKGAMQLTQDTVINHMHTTTENIFMLSSQQPLDKPTIEAIILSNYSRIPVYFGEDKRHVIGALIVDSLVKLCFTNPDPPPLVGNYPLREVMRLSDAATLYDAYMAFREGISNMAVIYNSIGVMMGLITLTDLLAVLYQSTPSQGSLSRHGVRRTDKIVGVMEGMKFLSQTRHIDSFLVSADGVDANHAQMTAERLSPRGDSSSPPRRM